MDLCKKSQECTKLFPASGQVKQHTMTKFPLTKNNVMHFMTIHYIAPKVSSYFGPVFQLGLKISSPPSSNTKYLFQAERES